MKYLDEYRDPALARRLVAEIRRSATRPWVLMEICGGQTHTLVKYGIEELVGERIELVHGPGCPVCVTPLEIVDKAIAIASTSGGHLRLLRRHAARAGVAQRPVPRQGRGRRRAHRLLAHGRLAGRARASASGRWCSSRWALRPPRRPMPWRCGRPSGEGLRNFSMLVSHVLVPPAIRLLLESPRQPRAGIHRPGPCLHGDGLRRIRGAGARVPRALRGGRVRAARSAGSHSDAGAATRRRPRAGGKPVRAQRDPRRQSRRLGSA